MGKAQRAPSSANECPTCFQLVVKIGNSQCATLLLVSLLECCQSRGQAEACRRLIPDTLDARPQSLAMDKRPRAITVISWIFIAFGSIALLASSLSLVDTSAAQIIAELKAHWMAHVVRILAVVSGVFMLYGYNWARWLLVVWLGYHVILSVLHSPLQLLVHTLFLAVALYFLFRPQASAYFRYTRAAEPPQSPKADNRRMA